VAALGRIEPIAEPASARTDRRHLSTGVVRLHDVMRLADIVEAEDPKRLDIVPAGGGLCCNLQQRRIRKR
jgi:hypothetical protein